MKRLHEMKQRLNTIFSSRLSMIILSILTAILIWFTVSVTIYPTTPRTIYNVPLVVELEGSTAEASGLSVVSSDVETVTVQIVGDRSQVGILSAEDLTAYAEVRNISSAGQYSLDISVRANSNVAFETNSISPAHVNVEFDRIETRTYEVTAELPNIVVTAGHTMDTITCDPATIDITGPSVQLDEIGSVVVTSDKAAELDSSYSLYSSEILLYTKEGAMMDTESLEIPAENFQINVPVLTQQQLQLTYDVLNASSTFDIDWLRERLHLSDETITYASTNPSLAEKDSWNMGYIKLEEIDLDFSKTFTIEEKEGYINQSGIQEVTLTLDSEGLSKRDFTISSDNIFVVNAPSTCEFEIITKSLTISVIGPTEVLDELSTKDIMVTVDLLNYNISQSASFSYDSTITFNDNNQVWAFGTYKIALNRIDPEPDKTSGGGINLTE